MAKTKREFYAELKVIAAGNDELVAFIDKQVELLDKKNSAPKKPTQKQIENEAIKDVILGALAKPMTVSEITKEIVIPAGYAVSTQRVSSIITQLKEDNAVVRTVVKRKAYFSVA